ncbi:ABC transporter substrate-binding protein [Ruegeria profundi]|uniref:ABC transporter substrate-binding protein n=1 Tax=Ruegeria profundi TaxID=1685378 RepID=UPI001CD45AF7|nr:ABC transporter substrate-binding protein [Ruegeria profundi]MCA0929760.1 ABC transporter substrate-binding protein [Ruegeria profundi]
MLLKKTMLAAGIMAALPFFAAAEQGVTHNSVTFAQVAAFEGPASALGTGMRLGLTAAFEEANAAGGVHGRNIKLDSMDDGYEPDRSAELVKTVVEDDKHIGLIGAVGTPTSSATQPIATEAGLPFIGPFTGAGFLREAGHGNIFNVRATYSAETEAWIEYLVDQQGMKSIALLYQDDGFGRVGLNGVTAALEKRGMTLAAEGTYTRNTTAVKKALLSIRKAKPDAVVMVGAYKPVAEFIKLARKMKLDATYVNISFVGSDALAKELGDAGEGVIVSQVVPFPWDDSNPLVNRYTTALAAVDAAAQPGFVSLEGYIVGRLTIAALEDAGKNLTRENFLLALASLTTVDLGGVTLHYGPGDNQGMDEVFLTRITADGTFEPVISGGGS